MPLDIEKIKRQTKRNAELLLEKEKQAKQKAAEEAFLGYVRDIENAIQLKVKIGSSSLDYCLDMKQVPPEHHAKLVEYFQPFKAVLEILNTANWLKLDWGDEA